MFFLESCNRFLKAVVSRYPFLGATLCFIVGIIVQQHTSVRVNMNSAAQYILAASCVLLVCYFLLIRIRILVLYFWFLLFGLLYPNFHIHEYDQVEGRQQVIIRIDSPPRERAKTIAFDVIILQVKDIPVFAKSIVYIQKDSSVNVLQYGDVLEVQAFFNPIVNQSNSSFDYADYMASKNVYTSAYISTKNWKKIDAVYSLKRLAFDVRSKALSHLKLHIHSLKNMQIIAALGFGDKSLLDSEVKQIFGNAGAMHILAVSGLHVGIIAAILMFILQSVLHIRVAWISGILIITGIWAYAFITGLSPSVQRAAIMCSILSVSYVFQRNVWGINSLAVAAFISLLCNPFDVFSVSFQLSYIAVAGIISGASKLMSIYKSSNKIITYVWGIIAVSIVVQIATLPISLYYFSYIPMYSLLTNICVIPLAFVILTGLTFCFIPFIGVYACMFVSFCVEALYSYISFVSALPGSIRIISISFMHMLILYSVVLALFASFIMLSVRNKERKEMLLEEIH